MSTTATKFQPLQPVQRVVPVTIVVTSPTFNNTFTAALDAAMTAAMNEVIAVPPAGFQPGSIKLLDTYQVIFDGTNYFLSSQFSYQTGIAV